MNPAYLCTRSTYAQTAARTFVAELTETDPVLKAPAGQKFRFFRHELLQKIEGTVEQARATGNRTVDTDAQPFAEFDALPALKRSARLTTAQKAVDELKQYEGRQLQVLWIEDSRGELEPATLDSIDRNITDEYTLEDGVWYEGVIDTVTKSYAKVQFDADGVTKQLNLFNEGQSTFLKEGVAWKWL